MRKVPNMDGDHAAMAWMNLGRVSACASVLAAVVVAMCAQMSPAMAYVPPQNIAPGAGVQASSQTDPLCAPSNANDYFLLTAWTPAASRDEWISLHFEQPQTLVRIVIRWEYSMPSLWRLEVSMPGDRWVEITRGERRDKATVIELGGVEARRVRLRCSAESAAACSIVDLQVWAGGGDPLQTREVPVTPRPDILTKSAGELAKWSVESSRVAATEKSKAVRELAANVYVENESKLEARSVVEHSVTRALPSAAVTVKPSPAPKASSSAPASVPAPSAPPTASSPPPAPDTPARAAYAEPKLATSAPAIKSIALPTPSTKKSTALAPSPASVPASTPSAPPPAPPASGTPYVLLVNDFDAGLSRNLAWTPKLAGLPIATDSTEGCVVMTNPTREGLGHGAEGRAFHALFLVPPKGRAEMVQRFRESLPAWTELNFWYRGSWKGGAPLEMVFRDVPGREMTMEIPGSAGGSLLWRQVSISAEMLSEIDATRLESVSWRFTNQHRNGDIYIDDISIQAIRETSGRN